MNQNSSENAPSNRGANFARNQRPAASKRVTFALGVEGQEQAERLARILSNYRKGGVSQSAVVRGLLRMAEAIALESGDPLVKPVMQLAGTAPAKGQKKVGKSRAESAMIWECIRSFATES